MNKEIKFCEDCKWSKWNWFYGKALMRCYHSSMLSFTSRKISDSACSTERKHGSICGENGLLWEAKR